MFRKVLFGRIAGKRRQDMATAGQYAENRAEDSAADHRSGDPAKIFLAEPEVHHPLDADFAIALVLEIAEDLGDAEHANRDGDEIDAFGKFHLSEGEPFLAGIDVLPDRAEKQAHDDHPERLQNRSVRQRNGDKKTEHDQCEIFRCSELQRHRGERRSGNCQQQGRHATGEERAECGRRQRLSGSALAGHLVAIDRRHGRRTLSWQVDQNGRGRAAILGTIIDARQHDQRGDRRKGEGDRQKHGDRRGRPDARKNADQRPQQDADEAPDDVDRSKSCLEAE
uniref:Uncharacterized 31.6 kDa protein in TAR-I ttuC' 3'region n=1 Tax=Agrobacterium vitis TaxID=373 RepID=YTZ4_AGRVI|nr:RecName: Full=Uncharacterized 31.6 kDa protein in TAR-I ttuC' 3'region; AltName: Full=ORFZ4 [Agrobacterium vitis]AAB61632.1 unknown [Agrobacterium vitis]